MMQANELRIGNLIRHNQNAFLHDHLKGKPRIVDLAILTNMVKDKGYFYEPIPLTVEILEACGFKVDINLKSQLYISYGGEFGLDTFLLWDGELFLSHEGYYVQVSLAHIKYLHQLQNLYYSLVGEDLKIDIQSL